MRNIGTAFPPFDSVVQEVDHGILDAKWTFFSTHRKRHSGAAPTAINVIIPHDNNFKLQ
jgi:hypothetical protein